MSRAKKDFLSIIIPAYREQKTIEKTILGLKRVLNQLDINYEIICVIDGIIDNTYKIAKKHSSKKVKVLAYEKNKGKGYAVQFGLSKARGNIVGFIDANGISPESVNMLLQHFYWYKADIIVGSKRHPVSKVHYPWLRRVLAWGYQKLIRVFFNLEIRDTQVGAKLFKRVVITKVLRLLLVKAWAFDIELLAVAYHKGFRNIYEAPIEMRSSADKATSQIFSGGFIRVSARMLWDTLAVFYRLKIKHFYD